MPKPNNPSGGQKGKPEHKVLVSGSIQAYPPPEIEKKHNAERKEDTATHETERKIDLGRESHKVWLERFTLLAVIVYAGITYWQGTLTRESIDNNSKQFQIDQRPYLWHSEVTNPVNVKIEAGQKMWMNLYMINFGKAPALKMRGIAYIFIGDSAIPDADVWFNTLNEKPLPNDPNDTGIVVPPGIPSGEITEKSAFGGGGFFTAMSAHVLKQDDVDYILHSDEKIAIVAHIQYFDTYGNIYWSNICLSRFNSGTYPDCKRNNEMH